MELSKGLIPLQKYPKKMRHVDENDFPYYLFTDEMKEDGLTPIKVASILQFFEFKGKTSNETLKLVDEYALRLLADSEKYNSDDKKKIISKPIAISLARTNYGLYEKENCVDMKKNNLIPIPDLTYCVLAKYPGGDRYFLREFHNYSIDELYWYRQTETFSGQSTAIENLRKYVSDKRVTLLYTPEQIANTQEVLRRLWKAEFKTEGQLDYKLYLAILEQNLLYEDYKDTGKNLTGFKTVSHQFELRIAELWKTAKK
jgi:hypothetical protein